LRKAW
ncbi:DEAD/DEAH box helicase family protein, partial [Vibrio parahaemolyticus V-223/04]